MLLEPPEVAQPSSLLEADRPVVILALDRIAQRLSLRMTLEAGIAGADEIELRRVDDVGGSRLTDVIAARAVAPLAADVPFGDGLLLDVVVDRVAAVAERTGRPLQVVGGIVRHPPVGVRLHEVRPPNAVH